MAAVWDNLAFVGNGVWECGKRVVVAVKQNPVKAAGIIIQGLFVGAIIYKGYNGASESIQDLLTGRISLFPSSTRLGLPISTPLDLEAAYTLCSGYPLVSSQLSSQQSIQLIAETTNKYKLSEDPALKDLALQTEELCEQGREIEDLVERLLHSQPDSVRSAAVEEYYKKSPEFSQSSSLIIQQYAQVISYLALPSQTATPSDLQSAYDICFNYSPNLYTYTVNLRDDIINTIDKYKLSENSVLKELALQAEEMCQQGRYLDTAVKLIRGSDDLLKDAAIEEFYKKSPEFSLSLSPSIRQYANHVHSYCPSNDLYPYLLEGLATGVACALCMNPKLRL